MALTRLLAAAAAAGLAAAQTSYAPATTSRLLAGQRQCQTLGRCGGVDPASSMIDPTIKLLLVSSPKAGATLVERLMLAALNWHVPRTSVSRGARLLRRGCVCVARLIGRQCFEQAREFVDAGAAPFGGLPLLAWIGLLIA